MTHTQELDAVTITWLGHAAFAVSCGTELVLIDPWLSQNPLGTGLPAGAAPTLILVTHGHFDHMGDAVPLSIEHRAPVIAPGEAGIYCRGLGAEGPMINIGGTYQHGDVRVRCVPAVHSSSVGEDRRYGGAAAGYLVTLGGITIYHAGDTALFGDMSIIGRRGPVDLALLPIGGASTMDAEDAVEAVRLVDARLAAPMHFGTWDFLASDAEPFARGVRERTDADFFKLTPGVARAVPTA